MADGQWAEEKCEIGQKGPETLVWRGGEVGAKK